MDEHTSDEKEVKRLLRQARTLSRWSIVGLVIPIVAWILGGIALSKIKTVREDYLEDSSYLTDKYKARAFNIKSFAGAMIILSVIVSVIFSGYLYLTVSQQFKEQSVQTCMENARSSYDPTVQGAAQVLTEKIQACQQ